MRETGLSGNEGTGLFPFQIDASFVDISTLTREAIAHQQSITSPDNRWTFHLHLRDSEKNATEDVPLVMGDRRSLRTVLEHLLENAIRFSPEGGRIDVLAFTIVLRHVKPLPEENQQEISPTLQVVLDAALHDCAPAAMRKTRTPR